MTISRLQVHMKTVQQVCVQTHTEQDFHVCFHTIIQITVRANSRSLALPGQ